MYVYKTLKLLYNLHSSLALLYSSISYEPKNTFSFIQHSEASYYLGLVGVKYFIILTAWMWNVLCLAHISYINESRSGKEGIRTLIFCMGED